MVGRALTVIAILLLVLAGCGDDDGNQRAVPETDDDGNQRARAETKRRTELASVKLEDGRRVVLRSFGGGTDVGPCLTLRGVDRYKRQCGRAPSERVPSQAWRPIIAEAWAQANPSAPLEIYGATSPGVVRVVVTFTTEDGRDRTDAALMRVTAREVLERAEIAKPFGYFIAELPADARSITADAFTSGGERAGTADDAQLRGLHRQVFISGTG